jgi:hypothetical protein
MPGKPAAIPGLFAAHEANPENNRPDRPGNTPRGARPAANSHMTELP